MHPLVLLLLLLFLLQCRTRFSVICFEEGAFESTYSGRETRQKDRRALLLVSAQYVILIMAQEQEDDVANDNRVRELLNNFYGSPSSSDSRPATMQRLRRLDSLQQIDFAEFDPDHYMNSLVWQFFLALCCCVVLFVLCCSFYKEMYLYSSWILICC